MTDKLSFTPGQLTLEQLQAIHADGVRLQLDAGARAAIRASAQVVQRAAQGSEPVYGVNTGFGKLANQRISQDELDTLQLNLIRSHSVGVGGPLQPPEEQLLRALKPASQARRHSGVRGRDVRTLL